MSTPGGLRNSTRVRRASGFWFVARLLVVLALGVVLMTFDPAGHRDSLASVTAQGSTIATSAEHHCVAAVPERTTDNITDPIPALHSMSLATPVTGADPHDAAVGACLTIALAALLAARKMLRPAVRPGDHPRAVNAPRCAAASAHPSSRQMAPSPSLRI